MLPPDKYYQKKIPGAKGQKHVVIGPAGHFLQEDQPEQIADAINTLIVDNPLPPA